MLAPLTQTEVSQQHSRVAATQHVGHISTFAPKPTITLATSTTLTTGVKLDRPLHRSPTDSPMHQHKQPSPLM